MRDILLLSTGRLPSTTDLRVVVGLSTAHVIVHYVPIRVPRGSMAIFFGFWKLMERPTCNTYTGHRTASRGMPNGQRQIPSCIAPPVEHYCENPRYMAVRIYHIYTV